MVIAKIDEYGKFGWIALVVLGFWLAWPLGLIALGFVIGSGRLSGFRSCRGVAPGAWFNMDSRRNNRWGRGQASRSGNNAFDDYRADTLRRLEDEEREFQAFLDRLRKARDKSEFDAFMAERRNRPTNLDDVGGETA